MTDTGGHQVKRFIAPIIAIAFTATAALADKHNPCRPIENSNAWQGNCSGFDDKNNGDAPEPSEPADSGESHSHGGHSHD